MPQQRATAMRLSREMIVDVYLRLIEAQGGCNVTLRQLGRELGADAAAVRRYARDRNEILAAVAGPLCSRPWSPRRAPATWTSTRRFAVGPT